MSTVALYEQDFHAWALGNAAALRLGNWQEVDILHLIEELEEMSSSTRRELVNRLAILLGHLLKWAYQPGARSRGWAGTIRVQRKSLKRLLRDNPSLRTRLVNDSPNAIDEAYDEGLVVAWSETGLAQGVFPETCPYTAEQILDEGFWPGEAELQN